MALKFIKSIWQSNSTSQVKDNLTTFINTTEEQLRDWKPLLIEDIVKTKRISYIDAVVLYCEKNNIDPSTTKSMINKNLKEKIAYEAQGLNMLKEKTAKLPI